MSSTRSVTSAKAGGTSPATMRSARPSTTAVLPTPASPVKMGLFCRRRVRMSIIWRISASRPITGSILPSRARSVRLVVYWSSAGVWVSPGAGCPASPWDAAPSEKATACPASSDPSVSAAKPPPGQLRQVRFGQQRQQQVPGADARRLRVQRRDQPGVLEQLGQMRRKHRRRLPARRYGYGSAAR
ncbi:hypothetical protein G6F57_018911 [Rhizopus arrhizus]|nr:hypothetical protein G6F57_018911 [Rhizopus arrhizus]